MNAHLLRGRCGEPNLELLTLGGSAGALVYAGTWLGAGLPVPPCAFRALTGLPCATCGATHCVLALMHGHVAEAFAWNPLVFAALSMVILGNVYSLGVTIGGLPRLRVSLGKAEARIVLAAIVVVVVFNWMYEIHHLA